MYHDTNLEVSTIGASSMKPFFANQVPFVDEATKARKLRRLHSSLSNHTKCFHLPEARLDRPDRPRCRGYSPRTVSVRIGAVFDGVGMSFCAYVTVGGPSFSFAGLPVAGIVCRQQLTKCDANARELGFDSLTVK